MLDIYTNWLKRRFSVIKGIAFILLGCACIFFRDWIYHIFPYIIGGFLILIGGLAVFLSYNTKDLKKLDSKFSSYGFLLFIIGVVIVIRGPNSDGLIGIFFGILGLYRGAESLNNGLRAIKLRTSWVISIVQAVIQVGLALWLLVDPVQKLYPHMQILGLELISLAIHLLWDKKKMIE